MKPRLWILLILFAVMLTAKAALGEVVINEIMQHPGAVPAADGEYIELYNNDAVNPININGWILDDDNDGPGGDYHLIDNGGELNILPLGFVVLCRNELFAENGGVPCDYEYSGTILVDGADSVILKDDLGAEIDRVDYDGGPSFPNPTGASMELKDPSLDNSIGSNWRTALVVFGDGDRGTPGAANNEAPVFDSVPVTAADEDRVYSYTIIASDANGDALVIAAPTLPSWLTFADNRDGTALLTGTPTNDDVGDHDVVLTVSDSYAPDVEQRFTITVANTNDAPVARDSLDSEVIEDGRISVLLFYTDDDFIHGDGMDTTIRVFNITGGTVIETPSCDVRVCTVTLEPLADSNANITANYIVNDGDADSNTADILVTVIPVNDAPVINSMSWDSILIEGSAEAVQDVESVLVVEASDIDSPPDSLAIDPYTSTINGIPFSDRRWSGWSIRIDELEARLIPDTPGDYDFLVYVTDGDELSAVEEFSLTVWPALEILRDSVEIMINGELFTIADELILFPGDEVTVRFSFSNNYDRILGHVETEAAADVPDLEGLPHLGLCRGVNCDDGDWALLPGETGEDEFTFYIPYDIGAATLRLNLNVHYDRFWGLLRAFEDSVDIDFEVARQEVGIASVDAQVSDDTLTCTRTTILSLTLVNTGRFPIVPEVLVYGEAQNPDDFDHMIGEFPAEELAEQELELMAPGEERTFNITVDAAGLAPGAQTLFIYVVNPYIEEDGFFIASEEQVSITIGSCLDREALEEYFTMPRNSQEIKSADLYDYIIEDQEGYSFAFALVDQSNPVLINCRMTRVVDSILECGAPAAGRHGTSELTLSISELGALSPLEEMFTVTVTPTLSIDAVAINGAAVENGGETQAFQPQQELTVQFMIANSLDHPVTGIVARLSSADIPFEQEVVINLQGGEQQQLSLQEILPLDLAEGRYPVEITAEGRDFEDNGLIQSEIFPFTLIVQQNPAEVVIAEMQFSNDEVACAASAVLTVEVVNRGRNPENDVVITVAGDSWELSSEPFVLGIGPGERQAFQQFIIPTGSLSIGSNTLTVTVSYRDDFSRDRQNIVITRNSCLQAAAPSGRSLIIGAGEEARFNVALSEEGFDNAITWTLTGSDGGIIEVVNGQPAYSFRQNAGGRYVVSVEVNAIGEESEQWSVQVVDRPFSNNFNINIPATGPVPNLSSFEGFTISNQFGEIRFTEPVNLQGIYNLDSLVIIEPGQVAVDAVNAPGLAGRSAIITLRQSLQNPVLLRSDGFGSGNFVACRDPLCSILDAPAPGTFVFSVSGFSTYRVLNEEPAALEVSEISIEDADRGDNVTLNVSIRNAGTALPISNLAASLTVAGRYNAEVIGVPASLAPQEEAVFQLQLSVPLTEDSGRHRIGTLQISGTDALGNRITGSASIFLSIRSYLSIDSVKVDGSTSGDLLLDSPTEIEVKVRNDYPEDMEDISVQVNLLDVDGDDLEEECDAFDLRSGRSDECAVELDLRGEKADEESYTLEIIVEGDADDGTSHRTVETRTVRIDRPRHQVIISRTAMSSTQLQCLRDATLQVTVENIGKNNEDEVEIKVSNSRLGLDLSRGSIDLDKYSGSDNDYQATFALELEDAVPGDYPIMVGVYRDGSVDDSIEVPLQIQSCSQTSQTTLTQPVQAVGDELVRELQSQLDQQLQGQRQQVQSVVPTTSFRESKTYVTLLGLLVVLMVIAVIMAMVVVVARKK